MTKPRKPVRVYRADKHGSYFSMARKTAQDCTLSFEARGMLAYLLSKPDDWELQPKDLQQNCGRDKVYKIIQELTKARYIEQTKSYDDRHRILGYEYKIYEVPYPEKPDTEKPKTDEPHPEKPDTEFPDTENKDTTYKRESQNTETTEIPTVVSNETTVPPSISVPIPPKDEKPKEEPAPEKPVEPSPLSEGKNPEPPGSDAPPMHIAIIDAYWAGIPDDLRPIGKPPYARHCRVAAELRDAGMTPERVSKFMAAKYPGYRAWCVGHNMPPVMPLEFVKKYIRAWITEDEKKSVAAQVEEFMDNWCDGCQRIKSYCVCGKEKPRPVESVVITCWEHARGILTVILPSAHRKLLSQIKPVEKRGDALVLEVSNPVFRDQLEMTLASKQFTDPIRLLSGGELTNFRVVVA